MSYTQQYLAAAAQVIEQLDRNAIEAMVQLVVKTRQRGGRLFVLGVGGSAGNASHAVNDFRKIAGIESYAPTDNVSELTARINDEGWDTAFAKWLEGSRLNKKGSDLGLVRRRWQSPAEYKCQLGCSTRVRQRGRSQNLRHRGAGWRLYSPSRRCLRYCADGRAGCSHAADGILPSRYMALNCLASRGTSRAH